MNIRISVFEMRTPYVTILLVPILPVTTLLVTILPVTTLPSDHITCDYFTLWPNYCDHITVDQITAHLCTAPSTVFFSEFFWFNVFTNLVFHCADLAMHKRPLRENDQSEEWILFRKIASDASAVRGLSVLVGIGCATVRAWKRGNWLQGVLEKWARHSWP